MSPKLDSLYANHGEGIRYIAFGLLTLVVSWVSYSLFVIMDIDMTLSNALSWVAAVVFAFFVNKYYVFIDADAKNIFKELIEFFGARIVTGIIAIVLFPILTAIGLGFVFLGIEGLFARGITSGVEIVLNYLFSKYMVFNTKK